MPRAGLPPANPPSLPPLCRLTVMSFYRSYRFTAVHQLPLNHSFHGSTVPTYYRTNQRTTASDFFIPAAIMIA